MAKESTSKKKKSLVEVLFLLLETTVQVVTPQHHLQLTIATSFLKKRRTQGDMSMRVDMR